MNWFLCINGVPSMSMLMIFGLREIHSTSVLVLLMINPNLELAHCWLKLASPFCFLLSRLMSSANRRLLQINPEIVAPIVHVVLRIEAWQLPHSECWTESVDQDCTLEGLPLSFQTYPESSPLVPDLTALQVPLYVLSIYHKNHFYVSSHSPILQTILKSHIFWLLNHRKLYCVSQNMWRFPVLFVILANEN